MPDAFDAAGQYSQQAAAQYYYQQQQLQHQQQQQHHLSYNPEESPNLSLLSPTNDTPPLANPNWTDSLSDQQVSSTLPINFQHQDQLQQLQQQQQQEHLHVKLEEQLQLESEPERKQAKRHRASTSSIKPTTAQELAASTTSSRTPPSLRKGSVDGKSAPIGLSGASGARRTKSMAAVDDPNRPKRVRTGMFFRIPLSAMM